MMLQEFLGEGFRAFQSRGGLARAEAAQACRLECVGHAEHQRYFRTHDRQIDALAPRELDQSRNVLGGDIDVRDARLAGRARIAGRDEYRCHPRRLRRLPRQRVLATAGADDENFHC